VVNRRTVVDQTTNEVEKLRTNLSKIPDVYASLRKMCAVPSDPPLAISTLRGQFADNREWSADPSRPAVICGTVDMIGSRLLFSGYGCGFKTRPLHAGFLGQDSLLVHDEAHLEPAFQCLIEAIRDEQKREPTPLGKWARLKVMELTATSRAGDTKPFTLTDADHNNATVLRRINAAKTIHFHENEDEKKLTDEIAELALRYEESGRVVLIFVRKVDDVGKIVKNLPLERTRQLTGTLRGLERDELVKDAIFKRFLPKAEEKDETVYLVCTSAGEVGVNISSDHLVCDLSTFESMAQRFGRVNRFGERADTEIHIVYPKETDFDEKDEFDVRRKRTLALLRELKGNGSPAALEKLQKAKREGSGTATMSGDQTAALRDYILEAFSPPPTILPVSDILFDAWALTTIRDKLPGRPPVEPYLHGISDYDPPQTTVAWRDEVELLTPKLLKLNRLDAETALELFPLKPHEELSGPTYGRSKVFEQLEEIATRDAKREPDKRFFAWVIDPVGMVTIRTLAELVQKDKQNKPLVALGGCTVLLPPGAGGLSGGLLKGDEPHTLETDYDVSSKWFLDPERTKRRRFRTQDRDDPEAEGMRVVRRIDIPATDDDENLEGWPWYWFELPRGGDDDGSKAASSPKPITWDHHTKDVTNNTERIATALELPDELRHALVLAAQLHDLGKKRDVWQRSIGNPNPKGPPWYAKSGRAWKTREITDYRHEFGSLIDTENSERNEQFAEFTALSGDLKAFVLHLIATHHGYGRPHFPNDRVFDPDSRGRDVEQVAREVPRRFARLQRKYGRWGLAYLESLLRAADYAASENPSEFMKEMS
jgi:CRISPR-associated endonuclease/helicase Cas3